MKEFNLEDFVKDLRQVIYDNFPFSDDKLYLSSWGVLQTNEQKHPNAPLHIRDVAFMDLHVFRELNTFTFDIGSSLAEEKYPYYHILEDSETIHISGRGTKTSKGSQDKISDKKARDYGRVNWNGKTYTQEYKKNVRGMRSKIGRARQYYVDSSGQVFRINEKSNIYKNVHYRYIERTLDSTLPFIAQTFGLKMLATKNSGLEEEMALQTNMDMGLDTTSSIVDILQSFSEE